MADITAPTYRLLLPNSEEFETVTVAFTADEAARLRLFVDCAAALLRTSIVKRGFRTTIDVKYGSGKLSAEWTTPTDVKSSVSTVYPAPPSSRFLRRLPVIS